MSLSTCTDGFLLASRGARITQLRPVSFGPSRNAPIQQTTPEQIEDIFTKDLAAEIAAEVQNTVVIPFIPKPAIEYVLTEAIQRLSFDLSPGLVKKVKEVLDAAATSTDFDDFSKEELDELAKEVSKELNLCIDAPILNEQQELLVLTEVFKIVFNYICSSDAARRRQFIETEMKVSRELFGTKESQQKLAEAVNKAVDIPLLDEKQEERILIAAVQNCAETLHSLLPPELIEILKGEQPDSISAMKDWMVDKVNQKVDLFGFDEKQEKALIEALVDVLIDQYVDGTEMEFLLFSDEEQRESLQEKCSLLEREIEISRDRFEREQRNLNARLERLRSRLEGGR